MIRCIIIEDQPPAQRVLQKYISDYGNMELLGTFTDALQAMDFLRTVPLDLIFLDIHLPKISGIEFLRTLHSRPNVILTTAFSEYALESYEYDVVDYLLKPFSFERFVQAMAKLHVAKSGTPDTEKEGRSLSFPEFIFIKSGYEHIKINVSNIRFIQSDADYTELFTTEKKYLSQEPLRYWEETLDPQKFKRIHKSYILNLSHIQKVIGNQIRLDEKTTLPIGRAFKEDFMKYILQ